MNGNNNHEQVFINSLMNQISNSIKDDENIFDASFFDAIMGIDTGFQSNDETKNNSKILNQLIRSNSQEQKNKNDEIITNEQIDLLLQSSNLLKISCFNNIDEQRSCRKRKFEYENIECFTESNSDNEEYSESTNESYAITSKNGSRSNNKSKSLSRTGKNKRQRNLSIDSSNESSIIKKESNKEAATRYRNKKLSEKDQLFETKSYLEKQNDDAKKRIDNVKTEINYLKNLLCQVLLTKGILS